MRVVDTNVILRYLLRDVEELYAKAEKIITETMNGKTMIFIPQSVIAEVVFVLQKVYKVPRDEIASVLEFFIQLRNCKIQDGEIIKRAISIYKETNLSFVDALLCAFKAEKGYSLETFDEALLKKCKH
ncbi:PIN domain-containing protein [Desulfurobacterium crinifex]